MKKTALALALSTLTLGVANAHETSHWKNSAGELVKNSSGECVQTINHNDADAAECHNGMAKAKSVVKTVTPAKTAKESPVQQRAEAAKKAIIEKKNEVLASLKKISLSSGASFNTGSANLSAEGKAELDSLSSKLKQVGNGLKSVTVEGHTDGSGPASFNQTLSQKRSDAVKAYLVAKGIEGSKIVSKGFGESQPIATNDTTAGRSKNRRVDIKVDGDIVESVK